MMMLQPCGKCGEPTGSVHRCVCGKHMHVFCGRGIGEQGYGQQVECPEFPGCLEPAEDPKERESDAHEDDIVPSGPQQKKTKRNSVIRNWWNKDSEGKESDIRRALLLENYLHALTAKDDKGKLKYTTSERDEFVFKHVTEHAIYCDIVKENGQDKLVRHPLTCAAVKLKAQTLVREFADQYKKGGLNNKKGSFTRSEQAAFLISQHNILSKEASSEESAAKKLEQEKMEEAGLCLGMQNDEAQKAAFSGTIAQSHCNFVVSVS
jgi:hypothetical protein